MYIKVKVNVHYNRRPYTRPRSLNITATLAYIKNTISN